MSEAGPSNPDKVKKRAASPVASASGVDEEIESQGAKRHRTNEGGFGPGTHGVASGRSSRSGVPTTISLRQGGNDGYLTGGGLKEAGDGTLIPANASIGRLPRQWAESIPTLPGGFVGQADRRLGGMQYVQRVAGDAFSLSRSGRVSFLFAPVNDFTGFSQRGQTEAQRQASIANMAVAVPRRDKKRAERRAKAKQAGSEKRDSRIKAVEKAFAEVYQDLRETEMGGAEGVQCGNCKKTTHETGACPVACKNGDTAVDSFCNSTFTGNNHPLDSDARFHNEKLVGCAVLVEHYEMGHLTELFIHFVVNRIHKAPLRVRGEMFCWVGILLRYAEQYCGGEMPAQITERGGYLPYTKNDAATYREELEEFDVLGVYLMPVGELDGLSIEEIREHRRTRRLRAQVHKTQALVHSDEFRLELEKRGSCREYSDPPEDTENAGGAGSATGMEMDDNVPRTTDDVLDEILTDAQPPAGEANDGVGNTAGKSKPQQSRTSRAKMAVEELVASTPASRRARRPNATAATPSSAAAGPGPAAEASQASTSTVRTCRPPNALWKAMRAAVDKCDMEDVQMRVWADQMDASEGVVQCSMDEVIAKLRSLQVEGNMAKHTKLFASAAMWLKSETGETF